MSRRRVKSAVAALALLVAAHAAGEEGTRPARLRLDVLARTLIILKDRYVDPARFAPRKMMVAALLRVSDVVGELVVEGDEEGGKLTLRMGGEAQEVDLAPIAKVWDLRPALSTALEFVAARTSVDPRELEYAAVNGVLSTLDLHTVLLPPAAARELGVQVRRDSAGLGLVVGFRRGALTVVKVLPGTEAERMGFARGDVITEIGGRSTAGRELEQIVEWLRGPPGSELAVARRRNGGPPQRVTGRRERVDLQDVAAQALLPDRIAYVKLSGFSGHAARQLRSALQALRGGGAELRGVILDVRDNPGGLLEQGVQVADLFLADGEIVRTTAASQVVLEEKRAHADAGDLLVPVVVLVNGRSAGAAEIVAASLRDNGRAVLVGERTLGLGGVQQLQDVGEPEAGDEPPKLKYTLAQRLSPGGRPWDGVGLVPEVVVRPGSVTPSAVSFFAPRPPPPGSTPPDSMPAAPAEEPAPTGTFTYLVEDGGGSAPGAETDEVPDPSRDALVTFAARILSRAATPDRDGLLAAAAALLPEQQAEEEERLAKRLATLGIDWARAPSDQSPNVKVTFAPLPRRLGAGQPVPWTVTVENLGPGPLSRLRAWTVAPQARHLDGLELLFGTLPAGAKRSATVQVPGGPLATGAEPVTLHFEEENGHAPADVAARFEVASIVRPAFSARLKLGCAAKKCGPLDAGAALKLEAAVRNVGAGAAGAEAALILRSADERVYLSDGRVALGAVPAGAERKAAVGLRLVAGSGGDVIPLEVLVGDGASAELTSCKLELGRGAKLPLTFDCPPVRLRLSPDPDAAPLATDGDRFALSGTASIPGADPVRRVIVRVNGRKAFLKSAPADAASLDFTADLPLRPGANAIAVIAETRAGKIAVRSFKIERR